MNAAASPWRQVADALPLRAWTATQRDAVAGIVSQSLCNWEQAWGLPAAPDPVRCVPAAAGPDASCWELIGSRGAANAWFERRPAFDEVLARALWGAPVAEGPIARAVQAACARDLMVRLVGGLRMEPPAARVGRLLPQGGPWSGALVLVLPWHGNILLDAAGVDSLLGRAPPPVASARDVVPLKDALAGRAVTVRVHLSDCELAVGALGELQVGDVLRLRHPLHEPLQLRGADGGSLFDASLARCGPFKSAQLVARSPATPLTGKAVP